MNHVRHVLVIPAVVGLALFVSAGRVGIWSFWAYVSLFAACGYWVSSGAAAGLLEERARPPTDRDRGTRRVALPLLLGHFVAAGIDVGRFGWSTLPDGARLLGLAVLAAGLGLVAWTLQSNPWASTAVRVQEDRGQRVVSTGPYAFVRHPMYLGTLLFAVGSPLALGSCLAAIPVLLLVPLFVVRTLREDRMLHDELHGYAGYARRVRARIIPGVF